MTPRHTSNRDGAADQVAQVTQPREARAVSGRERHRLRLGQGTPDARDAEGPAGWYRLDPRHTLIGNRWFLVAAGAERLCQS